MNVRTCEVGLDREALPLGGSCSVVLDILESLAALVHHQTDRICQPSGIAPHLPAGIDNVYFSLNLWIPIGRLADQEVRVDGLQLPHKVNHVGTSNLLTAGSFL